MIYIFLSSFLNLIVTCRTNQNLWNILSELKSNFYPCERNLFTFLHQFKVILLWLLNNILSTMFILLAINPASARINRNGRYIFGSIVIHLFIVTIQSLHYDRHASWFVFCITDTTYTHRRGDLLDRRKVMFLLLDYSKNAISWNNVFGYTLNSLLIIQQEDVSNT